MTFRASLVLVLLAASVADAGSRGFPLKNQGGRPAAIFLAPLLSSTVPVTRPAGTAVTTTRSTIANRLDSSNVMQSIAANVGEYHSTKGLGSFSGTTNSLLHRRDLSQAAWVATSASCTKTGTGVDGVTNSASVCSASASNGTIIQTLALAAATRVSSVYVMPGNPAGALSITRDNGGSWTTLNSTVCTDLNGTASNLVANTWARCQLSSSVLNPQIGFRISTTGRTFTIDFAQDEAGAVAGPVCDKADGTTAAVCAADVHTVPTTGWPTTSGEISFVYVPMYGTAPAASAVLFDSRTTAATNGVQVTRDTSNRIALNILGSAASVCSLTSAAQTWTANTGKTIKVKWTPTTCEALADGVSVGTAVGTGSPASHTANAKIGGGLSSIVNQADGWFNTACVGPRCP